MLMGMNNENSSSDVEGEGVNLLVITLLFVFKNVSEPWILGVEIELLYITERIK